MKKIALLMLCFAFIGCFSTKLYPPTGKTENDLALDETFCRISSGKITGLRALTPTGIAVNVGGANDKYNNCLREKGWFK
jgi:predicted membrane chloride channel (bestrophin family)